MNRAPHIETAQLVFPKIPENIAASIKKSSTQFQRLLPVRKRLTIPEELLLALLPTTTILAPFVVLQTLTDQRILFSSMIISAFLIYLDPRHQINSINTLIIAHISAALIGLCLYLFYGPGYTSASVAMILSILIMIILNRLHPPAICTSLVFSFRSGNETTLIIFGLVILIIAVLVLLEQVSTKLLFRFDNN